MMKEWTVACADCGRLMPEEKMTVEERWPYGRVRPSGVPDHVRGVHLRVCADRGSCAEHIRQRRMAIFVTACQATGSLTKGRWGYLWPLFQI